MTYTARLNKKITLPSGNWFTGFSVNNETRTIVYTYHDHRRNGQVARYYTVTFKDDLSTIESVTAVSAQGGRVEHFKKVSIRGDLANILRAAYVLVIGMSWLSLESTVQPQRRPLKSSCLRKVR